MQLMREKSATKITKERENDLWTRLGEQFQPLLVDVSLELRRTLQLPISDVSRGGELYRAGENDLLYYSISEDRKSVEIGAIYTEFPPQKAYDDFRQTVSEAVGTSKWSRISSLNERSQHMHEETEPFPQGSADLEGAKVLANSAFREILVETSRRTGVTMESPPLMTPEESAREEGVEALEQCGLIQREFQVFCRDTGIQLCKFNSRAALSEAAAMGFRSFSSGRPINQERVVQFLCISDRGRWLARRNLWLALCLADQLRELGVQPSQLRWTYERDYRTVLLLTAYQQAQCLFAVQEDSLTPDEAFRFFTRVRYYRPDAAFLVTPESIRQDARQVVARLTQSLEQTRVYIIHDLADLEGRLLEVVHQTNRKIVGDILNKFGGLTRVDIGHTVAEHLLGPEPRPSQLDEVGVSEEGLVAVRVDEPVRTSDSLLDLDLDLDLSDLELTPARSSAPIQLDDLDLDLDLDSLEFVKPKSEPAKEIRSSQVPVEELNLDDLDVVSAELDVVPAVATAAEEAVSQEQPEIEEEVALDAPTAEPAETVAADVEVSEPETPLPTPVSIPDVLEGMDDLDLDLSLPDLDDVISQIPSASAPVVETATPISELAVPSSEVPQDIAAAIETAPEPEPIEDAPAGEPEPEPILQEPVVAAEASAPSEVEPTPVVSEESVAPVAVADPQPSLPPIGTNLENDILADLNLDLDLDLNLDLDLDLPPVPSPTTAVTEVAPKIEASPVVEELQSPAMIEPELAPPQEPLLHDPSAPQESIPELVPVLEESGIEEKLDVITNKCLELVGPDGPSADLSEVFHDLRELPMCSGILSSLEGFVIQGLLRDSATTDDFAALLPDIWNISLRGLAEAEMPLPGSLVVESRSARLETHLLPQGLIFSVHQQLASFSDDSQSSLPGEMSLREAILKKVLEDLGELTEVRGNLVVSRDGLLVENQLGDEGFAGQLGIALAQLLTDSEESLNRLSLGPVRQFVIRSADQIISVMPLDAETILVTVLEPTAPREVWQARLQGAAQMLSSVFQ